MKDILIVFVCVMALACFAISGYMWGHGVSRDAQKARDAEHRAKIEEIRVRSEIREALVEKRWREYADERIAAERKKLHDAKPALCDAGAEHDHLRREEVAGAPAQRMPGEGYGEPLEEINGVMQAMADYAALPVEYRR